MGRTITKKVVWMFSVGGQLYNITSEFGRLELTGAESGCVELPRNQKERQELLDYIQEEQQSLIDGEKTVDGITESSCSDYCTDDHMQYSLVEKGDGLSLSFVNPTQFQGNAIGIDIPAEHFQLWLDCVQRSIDKYFDIQQRNLDIQENENNKTINVSKNSDDNSVPF